MPRGLTSIAAGALCLWLGGAWTTLPSAAARDEPTVVEQLLAPGNPDGNYIAPGVQGGIVYARVAGTPLRLDAFEALVDGASEVHMMVLAKFMRKEGRDFWQWGPGEGRRNAP